MERISRRISKKEGKHKRKNEKKTTREGIKKIINLKNKIQETKERKIQRIIQGEC